MTAVCASAGPLVGRSIVITRPAHQAGPLAERVRGAGGEVLLFPVIEIADAENLQPFHALVDRLDEFDIGIFVSPNAVSRAMQLIASRRMLPRSLAVAAVGDATVRALARHGVATLIAPTHGFDSEALLDHPALQDVAGKRIAIFRGQGGRELLADTLCLRGAEVEYAACYRRQRPRLDPAPLVRAWAEGRLDAIVVTSSEGLANLFAMVGAAHEYRLRTTPLFVPHARIAENAAQRGCERVLATAPGDEGLFTALCTYFSPGR